MVDKGMIGYGTLRRDTRLNRSVDTDRGMLSWYHMIDNK